MTTGKRTWICSTCGARTTTPAETWPPLTQERSGHFHRFERVRPGRPPADPDGSAGGSEAIDLDALEGFERTYADVRGRWFSRGKK